MNIIPKELLAHFYSVPEKKTINEFIEYAKENPTSFIKYCEVVIDRFGNIYMVKPSHMETLIYLDRTKHKMSRDEYLETIPTFVAVDEYIISKEKYIAVWYSYIKIPKDGINSRQKRSLDILLRNGLISDSYDVKLCDEYQLYQWRVEHGIG